MGEWTTICNKLGKVGWEYTLTSKVEEKRTRGSRVYDRSDVYKITMVSIVPRCTDKIGNVQV